MDFINRRSCGPDSIACATIIREWGNETPWMVPLDELEPMAASWRDLLNSDTAWVAESEGRVIGFCVREEDNITGLYVAPDAQSCGVGRALLDLAKINRDWITVWVYEKNVRARAFYRREELVEIGCEKDEDSHLMYVFGRWKRSI